jgi:hypothetical protein
VVRKTGPCLTLLAAAALSAACADKSPTGPATAGAAEVVSAQAATSPGRGFAPRSLGPRQSAPNGLIGTWGGDHVRITVGAASSILEFDCAHGTIDQPLAVDPAGQFNVAGTLVLESPGPIRENDDGARHPARYTGSTDGKTLTFTITLTDSGQALGPFVLGLDAPGRVFKCL